MVHMDVLTVRGMRKRREWRWLSASWGSALRIFAPLVLLMGVLGVHGACNFDPDFGDGAIACALNDSSCPPGLVCGADGRCHRPSPSSTSNDERDASAGPLSSLLITDVTVMEGNTETTDAIFTVRLVPASVRPVRVDYATVDDTATAPTDYTAASGTLFFEPGATSKPFIVKVTTNDMVQSSRRFLALLKNPENATLGIGQATGTIVDDDTFGLVATDTTVTEGSGPEGTLTNALFDVHLTSTSMSSVSVFYRAVEDTALEGTDFVRTSGRLVFAPGELRKTVAVPVKANARTDEPVRNFFLTLTNVTGNAPLLRARAQGKIIDDDAIPSISIDDVSVMEGNTTGGATSASASFHVRLSSASSRRITVSFATEVDGAAAAAANGGDFGMTGGMITFDPGQVEKTISVPINGDTLDEDDETFNVRLESPTNATIAKAVGVGSILNDDSPPKITVDDIALQEGPPLVSTAFPFRLRLSEPSGRTVSVQVETVSDTATAGTDFVGIAPTIVTFAPGTTEKVVNVSVNGDATAEGAERFVLRLSRPVNATIARADGRATILDDDSTLPAVTISDVTITENNVGVAFATFTITLSPGAVGPVTVQWATEDETAEAGSDYVAASGVVTFTSPQESKAVNIVVNGDTLFEADEAFLVRLTSVSPNANILDAEGRCTITNDDTPPEISIVASGTGAGTVTEGASGTTKAISFNVALSAPSAREVTVNYFTTDETATSTQSPDADYLRRTGLLVFQPGETSKTISVVALGDDVYEPDPAETFLLTLATPKGATLAPSASSAQGRILNDDAAPVIAIGPDIDGSEGAPGAASSAETLRFNITLDRPSSRPINVSYATADETAIAGADYVEATGVLTFAPGETRKFIPITINGDNEVEPSETFTLTLSSPAGAATLGRAVARGTILNDDGPSPTMTIGDAVVVEGNSGIPYSASFTVALSAPTSQTVSVHYATSNGTADATDYVATAGTLTFAPNETMKTINISIRGDTTAERDETFFVTLDTPTNAVIFQHRGQATIVNDD